MKKKPFWCRIGFHDYERQPVGMLCPMEISVCTVCGLERTVSLLNPLPNAYYRETKPEYQPKDQPL